MVSILKDREHTMLTERPLNRVSWKGAPERWHLNWHTQDEDRAWGTSPRRAQQRHSLWGGQVGIFGSQKLECGELGGPGLASQAQKTQCPGSVGLRGPHKCFNFFWSEKKANLILESKMACLYSNAVLKHNFQYFLNVALPSPYRASHVVSTPLVFVA